jgi:hypothetical protein
MINQQRFTYDDSWYDVTDYGWDYTRSPPKRVSTTSHYNPQGVRYTAYHGSPWSSHTSSSPVLLDLNGDQHVDLRPLDFSDPSISPAFDWNGDGLQDDTSWVGPDDGLLAIDLGRKDGAGPDDLIDQARELAFASWATEEQTATNDSPVSDLDGLRLVFDSNHDNVLDGNDDRWSEFRVWRDANQNGISDRGELQTMSEAGIKLINLLHTPEGAQAFDDGSAITGTSSYETEAGSKLLVADATLAYRAA